MVKFYETGQFYSVKGKKMGGLQRNGKRRMYIGKQHLECVHASYLLHYGKLPTCSIQTKNKIDRFKKDDLVITDRLLPRRIRADKKQNTKTKPIAKMVPVRSKGYIKIYYDGDILKTKVVKSDNSSITIGETVMTPSEIINFYGELIR